MEFADMLMNSVPESQDKPLPEPTDTCTPEYKTLLEQIVKGAEYIASIDEKHKNWKAANEKYERLCAQAIVLRDK
jgi:hypothetical protein